MDKNLKKAKVKGSGFTEVAVPVNTKSKKTPLGAAMKASKSVPRLSGGTKMQKY